MSFIQKIWIFFKRFVFKASLLNILIFWKRKFIKNFLYILIILLITLKLCQCVQNPTISVDINKILLRPINQFINTCILHLIINFIMNRCNLSENPTSNFNIRIIKMCRCFISHKHTNHKNYEFLVIFC